MPVNNANGLELSVELLADSINLGSVGLLEGLAAVRATADMLIQKEVTRARSNNVPWHDIGVTLELSAQGAQQRYKNTAPRARNRGKNAA